MDNNDNKKKEEEKNSLDFELLKSILTARPTSEEPEQENIFKRIGKQVFFYGQMKTQNKIIDQLEQANLDEEFSKVDKEKFFGFQIILSSMVFGSMFALKKWTIRLLYLATVYQIKKEMFEPYLVEYRLRRTAKLNTLLGQEVRNLYLFYYGNNEITNQMAQQCKSYNEIQRIRKEIYKNKL